MDADILDGLLVELYELYGSKVWFDLFSTFLPPDETLPVVLDTVAKQATWFVAAISASTGLDLRSTFATDYGFPVDDASWPDILTHVQQRIAARPLIEGDFDANGDCTVDLADYAGFTTCAYGPGLEPSAECVPYDFDSDGDVDLADYGRFQIALPSRR